MTFPCLICGELPIIDQPSVAPNPTPSSSSSSFAGGIQSKNVNGKLGNQQQRSGAVGVGTTIRTLSKDVSDKIFQNLCKQLAIKSDPSWLMLNPGEQMPLCPLCSATVLEIYTLQTKVDHFTTLIKKHVTKLERIVADTEIATNWMATKEERENEEQMWNSIPCAHASIRIARERHDKFRNLILQNFKSKVKQRLKLRAAGQQDYDPLDTEVVEPVFQIPSVEPSFSENGEKSEAPSQSPSIPGIPPLKRLRPEKMTPPKNQSSPVPTSSSSAGAGLVGGGMSFFKNLSIQQRENVGSRPNQSQQNLNRANKIEAQEFHDEDEMSDEQEQAYPDVQIVCTAGAVDYDVYKDETEYSGDGDESMEQDGSMWYTGEDYADDEESMTIPDGEEVVWLAHNVALRKSFLEQLLIENLKPSVFLRKLMFAVFGLKQIAMSSGTTGSNKPGAKPSLDRQKYEALRDYTIDTYGIRDDLQQLDDLNRKIRTICCDARKALKRKAQKPPLTQQSTEGFGNSRRGVPDPNNSDEFAEVTGVAAEEVMQISIHSGNAMQARENDSGEALD